MSSDVQLIRDQSDDTGTFGRLIYDSSVVAYTLELPWKDDRPDVSCIPLGTYQVIPHNSHEHPNVWEITNVPNRSEILLHSGNFLSDTKGCLLAGDSQVIINGKKMVTDSVATINKLRGILPQYFSLEIVSAC